MPSKSEQLQFILDGGIIAIIRTQSSAELVKVAGAIREGGVRSIEVTMTTPNALEVIRDVAAEFKDDVLVGAGTVLDPETARAAILAGAEYIVAPTLNPRVIELCRRYSKISVPGTFTPTEILTAWELGADLVKVFPAGGAGPQYIKDIRGPLPQIPLVPTGGVSLENAADFIKAGAAALAVGGNLVDRKAIAAGNFGLLTETARKFVGEIKKARAQTGS